MDSIVNLVREALETGFLSITAENKLRLLLNSKYSLEDFNAFTKLQLAIMKGIVKQESRELILSQPEFKPRG